MPGRASVAAVSPGAAFPQLVYNVGWRSGNCTQGDAAVAARASTGERTKPTVEERMTVAEQAFYYGDYSCLFVAILRSVCDKLRALLGSPSFSSVARMRPEQRIAAQRIRVLTTG